MYDFWYRFKSLIDFSLLTFCLIIQASNISRGILIEIPFYDAISLSSFRTKASLCDIIRDIFHIPNICASDKNRRRTVLLFQFHGWTVADLSRCTLNESRELFPTWRQHESGTRMQGSKHVRRLALTSHSSMEFTRTTICCIVLLARQSYSVHRFRIGYSLVNVSIWAPPATSNLHIEHILLQTLLFLLAILRPIRNQFLF